MKIKTCEYPICPIHSNTKYCIRRSVGSIIPQPVKKIYNIPKRSKKRILEQKEYVEIVKSAIEEDNECEIKSPDCIYFADGLDHSQKRSPKNFLDKNNLKRACSPCNFYKELHPKWATKNGHSISRFKK